MRSWNWRNRDVKWSCHLWNRDTWWSWCWKSAPVRHALFSRTRQNFNRGKIVSETSWLEEKHFSFDQTQVAHVPVQLPMVPTTDHARSRIERGPCRAVCGSTTFAVRWRLSLEHHGFNLLPLGTQFEFKELCDKMEELVLQQKKERGAWKDLFFFLLLNAHEDQLREEYKDR